MRERDLGEYMSRYLIDQIGRRANVRVLLGTEVRELVGDQSLGAVVVSDQTRTRRVVRGPDAPSEFGGTAGEETWWPRSVLEISQPGMFAVGDVRSGSVKRVAAAVGEGAMAIRLALERMQSM